MPKPEESAEKDLPPKAISEAEAEQVPGGLTFQFKLVAVKTAAPLDPPSK